MKPEKFISICYPIAVGLAVAVILMNRSAIPETLPIAEKTAPAIEVAVEEVVEPSVQDIIVDFLRDKGLSDYAVAGILANMHIESDGLVPGRVQYGYGFTDEVYCETAKLEPDGFATDKIGFGLCQWTHSSRKYRLVAESERLGLPVEAVEVQLNVLWQELNGEFKWVLRDLQAASNPREAAVCFMLGFENPADQSLGAQVQRAELAETYFVLMKGGQK